MRPTSFLFLALAASANVFAAPETYTIEASHTAPYFSYNHLGYSTQQHRFDRTSGKIVLDRAAKSASVEISIDAKSVNTGYALFNEHIQGADYFDSEHHPVITFNSTAVKFKGDKPVAIVGNLTLKGITRPVTLSVTRFHAMPHPMLKREAIGANATARIKRSDFNMGKHAPHVSDEVDLTFAVEAVKE